MLAQTHTHTRTILCSEWYLHNLICTWISIDFSDPISNSLPSDCLYFRVSKQTKIIRFYSLLNLIYSKQYRQYAKVSKHLDWRADRSDVYSACNCFEIGESAQHKAFTVHSLLMTRTSPCWDLRRMLRHDSQKRRSECINSFV